MRDESTGIFLSPAQKKTAQKILKKFTTSQLITLIAPPQWGKTGTFLRVAYKMCLENDVIATQVYIITGMADKIWEKQTKQRMLPEFRNNVYHRGRVHKLIPDLKQAENALLIIDECHFASNSNQTIKKVLEESGLLDINNLIKKNIKILQTSATPDNVLLDSKTWSKYHTIITPLNYGESYTSFQSLIDENRIFDSHNLSDSREAQTFFEVIKSFKKAKYHIIRLPRKGKIRLEIDENIEAFCKDYDFNYYHYDSTVKDLDMDELLEKKPKNHTIITIVDYWRAAKTVSDKYLGVVHERLVQRPNTSTITQSLAGRCLGHNKNKNVIIFTNIKAVEQYISLCKNNFEYEATKYYSTSINSNGEGTVIAKPSYAHDCEGVNHERYENKVSNDYGWSLFKGDNPMKDAETFVQKYLGRKTLPAKTKNADGFYVQNDIKVDPLYTFNTYFTKDGKPNNTRIFKGLSGNNANEKKRTNWRQYAIYKDEKDVNSLMWFICWRKNVYPDAPSM